MNLRQWTCNNPRVNQFMEFSDRADGDLKCKFLDTLETLHMVPFLKKAQKRIWDSIPDQKKCHERVGVNI